MGKKKEESIFVKFWGGSSLVRVLDFFLDNYLFDYSKTKVAEATGLSRVTVHKVVEHLKDTGVLKLNREVGRAKMYTLNRESPIVDALIELEDTLLNEMEKTLEREAPSKNAFKEGVGMNLEEIKRRKKEKMENLKEKMEKELINPKVIDQELIKESLKRKTLTKRLNRLKDKFYSH